MKKIEKKEMKALKGGLKTGLIVCLSDVRCYFDIDVCARRCPNPFDCVVRSECP